MTGLRLIDICEFIVDCEHKTAPLSETGYPSIRTPNVGRGRLMLEGVNRVNEAVYEAWTRRAKPRGGDIIVAREAPVGNVALVMPGQQVCLGQRTVLLRPDSKKVDCRFLTYLLLADFVQNDFRSKSIGATVPHLNMADIRGLKLPQLPTPAKQVRIADILSAYDDLIEVNQRRIAVLEDMARRLFDEWFVRFRYPGHETVPLVETELGMVPEEWKLGTVQDVVVLQRGFDLPNTQRSDGPYPVMAATGEHGLHSEFKVRGPGIVTGRSGSLGKVMHISGDFWPLNTTLWGKDYPLGSTYFAYFTVSNLPFDTLNAGAAVPSLNRNHVHLLPQIVPPHDVVALFDKVVAPMFALKRSLLVANARLRAARDLLLPKLVSGQIDVSAAEETFAEAAE